MKVKKEIDLTALQLAIFGLSATKAKAILAAVGVQKSDFGDPKYMQNPGPTELTEALKDTLTTPTSRTSDYY